MKRLHISLAVADVTQSADFYTALFGAAPTVRKPDYAKWMLDDPRVNFAITSRGRDRGLNHLGIQADSEAEHAQVLANLRAAKGPRRDEGHVTCCYARSEKSWIRDPQGVAWEAFRTTGDSDVFGDNLSDDGGDGAMAGPTVCCAPPDTVTDPNPCCA